MRDQLVLREVFATLIDLANHFPNLSEGKNPDGVMIPVVDRRVHQLYLYNKYDDASYIMSPKHHVSLKFHHKGQLMGLTEFLEGGQRELNRLIADVQNSINDIGVEDFACGG